MSAHGRALTAPTVMMAHSSTLVLSDFVYILIAMSTRYNPAVCSARNQRLTNYTSDSIPPALSLASDSDSKLSPASSKSILRTKIFVAFDEHRHTFYNSGIFCRRKGNARLSMQSQTRSSSISSSSSPPELTGTFCASH